MLNKIKIAQISDSHLLSDKTESIHGINPYQRLSNIINHMNKNQYDLVLFTGDIANDGDEKSYDQLLELTRQVKSKILIIPGNHDAPHYLEKSLSHTSIFIVAPQEPILVGNWFFLYLDTVVKSEKYGYITDDNIQHLVTNLKKTNGHNVCILMHHHPFDIGVTCVDKYKIRNAEKMINVLTSNIKLVVHGHVHNDYTVFKNIIYSACPSTSFQFVKNDDLDNSIYGYKEYMLSKNEIISNSIWFQNNSPIHG